ncbi:MAG: Lrp/AsnC family transcriptional regulator [Ilumatobacter fluminis]|uniref:Lrp/AsnC family transcriptional regulator n=1 Tax=Ilumatobacter fluminis TaxID=467091 RepID=UPI0032ECFF7C
MSTEEIPALDAIDRQILRTLAADGRISVTRLAADVALSSSATSDRLRRLEASGAIEGYRAVLAPSVLARPIDAVVGVRAASGTDRDDLETWICDQPAVVEAVHLTGPHDYLLRLRCRSTAELDALLMSMKRVGGIADTETRVVLRSLPVRPATV